MSWLTVILRVRVRKGSAVCMAANRVVLMPASASARMAACASAVSVGVSGVGCRFCHAAYSLLRYRSASPLRLKE